MAFDINTITMTGNLGGDPKVEYLDEGTTVVTSFSLAQNLGAKDKEGKNAARWWNVRIRNKVSANGSYKTSAEEAGERLKKGDRVVVSGRMTGWLPDGEYEKESKWEGYKAQIVLFVEADAFQKVDVPVRANNRDELPPM